MTRYEELQNKIDTLRHAGDACMAALKTDMAIIWYTHAAEMMDTIDNLPTDIAGSVVV